ncbi:3865_t:CDS:2 [Ambispora leptoticha]|uniref:3865_t:CDS:1 n=1 Tax=Ambispora leptoticha TaxID=144679 RepID=A0A9N9AXE1_9GLOM|nr:3865_t:CDS:2 [Ambispora leptoticha]
MEISWKRLTARKRNPLTEDEASNINPIIESFLKHEIERYQQKKQRQRRDPNSITKFLASLSSDKEYHITETSTDVHSSVDMIEQNSNSVDLKSYCFATESTLKDMEKLLDTKSPALHNKYPSITYTEQEFNARLKEEADALHERFVKASKQKMLEISNDISRKSAKLGIETMKSWIQDGSKYVRIRELEINDGKGYSDQNNRGA